MRPGNINPNPKLEKVLDTALNELSDHDPTSEDYAQILEQVVKLHKMKTEEKPSTVSPDTLALIAANLVGIVIILKHEHVGIITSKAFGFVLKPR